MITVPSTHGTGSHAPPILLPITKQTRSARRPILLIIQPAHSQVGMAHLICGPSQLVYGYFFPPPDGAFPRPPPDGFPVVLGQLPPPPLPPPPLGIFHPSCRLTSAHEVRDTVGLDYRKPQTASISPMPCARRTLAGAPSLIASRNERHASPQKLTYSLRWVHHHRCPGHSLYRHWRAVWRA